jgi:hypothetical protein
LSQSADIYNVRFEKQKGECEMKDLFLVILTVLVSINLLYAIDRLETVTNELKLVEKVWSVQMPDHDEDFECEEWENGYTDEEWTELLGL